jgi:hypothetical protein
MPKIQEHQVLDEQLYPENVPKPLLGESSCKAKGDVLKGFGCLGALFSAGVNAIDSQHGRSNTAPTKHLIIKLLELSPRGGWLGASKLAICSCLYFDNR